jgi:hypothetical protein
VTLPASLFHPEPPHGWCYYFEKAELARQFGDWETVAKLGEVALQLGEHPDPMERFVFVEGYAHVGDWDQAVKLSRESYKVSRNFVGPPLCWLWQRIEIETMDNLSDARTEALSEIENMLACNV